MVSARRIVFSRCVIMITVRPFMRRSSPSMTSCSDSGSSEAVGSSMLRIGALRMKARAIPRRWRWPPDKVTASFAYHCIVAGRHLDDELVGVGELRGRQDLLLGRMVAAVGDVLSHRAAKEHSLLQHEADVAADTSHRVLADVAAVDPDATRSRIVEAWNQADDRRLAAAGRSDHADELAARDREADVTQHADLRLVGERDVLERQPRRRTGPARARPADPGCSCRSSRIDWMRSSATLAWATAVVILARSCTGLKKRARYERKTVSEPTVITPAMTSLGAAPEDDRGAHRDDHRHDRGEERLDPPRAERRLAPSPGWPRRAAPPRHPARRKPGPFAPTRDRPAAPQPRPPGVGALHGSPSSPPS